MKKKKKKLPRFPKPASMPTTHKRKSSVPSATPKPTRAPHIGDHTYDPETETLTVTFSNGKKYSYAGVPKSVAAGFRDAPSRGQYLHRHIKGTFTHKLLD